MTHRVIVVVLLSLLSISLWAPDMRRGLGSPNGTATFELVGRTFKPTAYAYGGSIAPYVDLERTALPQRLRWMRNGTCWTLHPGERCDLYFIVGGRKIHLTPTSRAPAAASVGTVILLRGALALLWLFCAAAFLLIRPSRATWAFFILSLYGWSPNNVYTMVGPAWLQLLTTTFENIWEVCIPLVAPLFALYLLQPDPVPRWRRVAERCTYALIAATALYEVTITWLGAVRAYTPSLNLHYFIDEALILLALFLTNAFLFATYFDSDRVMRQRIRWVLAGFLAGSVALALIYTPLRTSYIAYSIFQAIYVFAVTASTGYAVLRHRIIDINVVLSRTLVYTLLSALVVGLFALVDLFFSRTLTESNAGLMADVALALVLGFFMNTMHHRLDRFVDGILFRKRHLAEEHIALVAQALRHAEDERAVNRMLVDEPVRSFDLQFGALTRRCDADALEVAYAAGDIASGTRVDDAEALCAYLLTERKPLVLRRHFWSAPTLRSHDVEPSIAVPLFSHDDLTAVVFFAPHRNGTEFDGDELALIDRVAEAAGAAYDRLEAKALRQRFAERRLDEAPT